MRSLCHTGFQRLLCAPWCGASLRRRLPLTQHSMMQPTNRTVDCFASDIRRQPHLTVSKVSSSHAEHSNSRKRPTLHTLNLLAVSSAALGLSVRGGWGGGHLCQQHLVFSLHGFNLQTDTQQLITIMSGVRVASKSAKISARELHQ